MLFETIAAVSILVSKLFFFADSVTSAGCLISAASITCGRDQVDKLFGLGPQGERCDALYLGRELLQI